MVTVELKNGETYRGMLEEAEDTMNCQLKEVTMTSRDGRIQRLEHVFLRGGNIKFIVLPDILKNAPVFKKIAQMKAQKSGSSGGRDAGGAQKKARTH